MNRQQIETVRELARQYMDIAQSELHVRMRRRFHESNDLKIVRPPLVLEELPWNEFRDEPELACLCEDPRLRAMEENFRRALYRERHFRCDNFIEPVYAITRAHWSTGCGFTVEEDRVAIDSTNHIVSHRYHDVLADESALDAYRDPVIHVDPDRDAAEVAFASEVLDGIMPVELRGVQTYHAPWDVIPRLRGVEPILEDMIDRPEYLHRIISLFTRAAELEMDQKEALGLFDPRPPSIHCTPSAVTVPHPSDNGRHACDVWFRTMAQMFSMVSPDALYEFDIQYSLPLSRRFAFTYYGCCEPLHDRIHILKRFPNLRKVGASPWADVERTAEALGPDFVLSRKPNPANVAHIANPDVIRAEAEETIRVCQKYGCPCEFILKDISTVGYRPANLEVWTQTVSEALDRAYGPA